MENRVENTFEKFVGQFKSQHSIPLDTFFYQAEFHLIKQLKDYLKIEQSSTRDLFSLLEQAKKTKNKDTSKHFWDALFTFNQVGFNIGKGNVYPWLRYVNIIESLQGYTGSQLFAASTIKLKRQHRLYFAYMLTWEHLRYIAGNDDDYSPSSELLALYSQKHSEEDHQHSAHCDHTACGHSH